MRKKSVITAVIWGLLLAGGIVGLCNLSVAPPSPSIEPTVEQDIRGMWVASISNLDFPSAPDQTPQQLQEQIDRIIADAVDWGLNTIVFQVRPTCDALYASSLFPVSKVLSSTGELPEGFDPLAYAVNAAHKAGIQLHAWVNPLRVTSGTTQAPQHDLEALPKNSPAYAHPDWVVPYADGKLYLDPGLPQVQQLVVDGVMEIVNGYDVDGIHFDDYFYPYPIEGATFDDSASFAQYGEELSLEDWRRNNITRLVSAVHTAITESGKELAFGISPFAVWQNASSDALGSNTTAGVETYSDLYADTRSWVKEGLVDYICPQIYWSFEQQAAPYATVFDWWADCVKDTDVSLWVGHAFYKQGTDQPGWEDATQTMRQVEYAAQSEAYGGSLFFRYGNIKADPVGATTAMAQMFEQEKQTAS